MDIGVGVAGLLIGAPIIVGAALAMIISGDRGPLFYRARRVGEGGRSIIVYKVRTMRVASDGLPITSDGDARITPVGRWLRRYKLDELPQFANVVRGEMSAVGPRPEDPSYVDWTDPLHRYVFSARPGITGPSQIAFRHEERLLAVDDPDHFYRAVLLPRKLTIDACYLGRRTLRTDIAVLAATVAAVFR